MDTNRRWLAGAAAAGLGLAFTVLFFAAPLPAQPGDASSKKPDAGTLPIGKVILFSSGVGYFQREGDVQGDARIDLSFPTANINDLLKSLVLQDLDGGKISAVSYDSSDPIEKTLKSFAIDLTANPSMGELLKQARGEKVEVALPPAAANPGTFTGTIVGVETRKVPSGKDGTVDAEYLNLFTAKGLQSLPLAQVEKLSFLNPTMDNELKRALETLALSHDTQKKSVSLSFSGQGKRAVRVGYVIEHPIWKTSYRLVLDKDGKPFLQGWAIVENPTDEDWQNVRVTLVSGRPISFKMDLYQPLYVSRPTVEPELFASLRPPTYDGAMDAKDRASALRRAEAQERAAFDGQRATGGQPASRGRAPIMTGRAMGGMGGGGGIAPPGAAAEVAQDPNALGEELKRNSDMRLDQGVTSAATGAELGDFFQYAISAPVSITRKKSAMLPIINQAVDGSKVTIYNEAVHAKHPLHGLKLKNTSGLHLMQGPITVFEGNSYSGDARIMDLQPNEERLISYAMDLGTEVSPESKSAPDQLTMVKIVKGVLQQTSKQRLTKTFTIKNRDDKPRKVIIEHPIKADWKLAKPEKPAERSRGNYRFEQSVPAGDVAKLEVVEEREQPTFIALANFHDDASIRFYLSHGAVSERVKDALKRAVALRQAMADAERQRNEADQQVRSLREDQAQARENLKTLPNTSAAYRRFLEKIDSVQNDIEKGQEQIKKLRADEAAKRREYEAFLNALTVE